MDLKTGDIILFNNQNGGGFFKYFADMIRYGTHSNYTHIGFIIKDPTFINSDLKGTFVWESGWEGKEDPQDGGEMKKRLMISRLTSRPH